MIADGDIPREPCRFTQFRANGIAAAAVAAAAAAFLFIHLNCCHRFETAALYLKQTNYKPFENSQRDNVAVLMIVRRQQYTDYY